MSGLCAAIAAARHGVKTALVQARPMLGGNASSEIRMHICGADDHMSRPNARETGILEEILLEHKRRNPTDNYAIFDTILWEKAAFCPNLTLFLNACVDGVKMENGRIRSVTAYQQTTEKSFVLEAPLFADATRRRLAGLLGRCGLCRGAGIPRYLWRKLRAGKGGSLHHGKFPDVQGTGYRSAGALCEA